MRVLFIRGGGHEGICVFQEGICIPFQVLFFRLKKKKKHQATDFSKCEIISLLFNIGEKKIIPNHVNICSMLLFKSQVTQGLRT